MPTLRPIALALLLTSACSKEAPPDPRPESGAQAPAAPKAAVTPPTDPHAIAKARDDDPPPPPLDPTVGTFDATIDGAMTHFLRLPRGQNRAVAVADAGIARVSIAAAEGHEGWPHFRIVLDGLKLDAVELPLTLPSDAMKDVEVSVRYQVNENRIYTEEGAKMQVTLDSFAGSVLRGSFEGALAPTKSGLGDPIPVSGKFEVELGLRGISPGPNPDGSPAEAQPSGHDMTAKVEPAKPEPAEPEPAEPEPTEPEG